MKRSKLKWYGAKSELIELTKALIENGNLKGKQEDIFNEIQEVFNIELNNIDQAITKFNTRNQENETKFLDTLKNTLSKYIKSKLEKNR
ncbi:RteC domain-containing protein [Polaribacter atrinae]|uniref:RteC domain-containing protein n=1 Tax=Polaribacter atrinae TaxID=1333662 RepID=UPI003CD0CFE8